MVSPSPCVRARGRGVARFGGLALMVIAVGVSLGCAESSEEVGPPSTLEGVGRLPEELSTDLVEYVPSLPLIDVEDGAVFDPIGDLVDGNRVLVIGDSIIASASKRYGNEICDLLVPLGWEVEVNAEVGRFIDFGNQVLRSRLDPANGLDWDAAVISLGTNYNNDPDRYRAGLETILEELEPRPVLLLTVTEWRSEMAEVNDVIVDVMQSYPFVRVVDWATITESDDRLLQRDGIHLTEAGRDRLARVMAEVLGMVDGEGLCRDTRFSDDSAGEGEVDIGVTTTTTRSSRPSTTVAGDDSGSDSDGGDSGDGSDSGSDGSDGGSGDGSDGADDGSGGSDGSSTGTTSPTPAGDAPPSSDG